MTKARLYFAAAIAVISEKGLFAENRYRAAAGKAVFLSVVSERVAGWQKPARYVDSE